MNKENILLQNKKIAELLDEINCKIEENKNKQTAIYNILNELEEDIITLKNKA